MSISPNPIRRTRLIEGFVLVLAFLCGNRLLALDGNRAMAQYVHNTWGPNEGFAGGTVFAIAQSQDGYIWLGTEHGLVRFDGTSFTQIEPPLPEQTPIGAVRSLIEDSEGNLWIRLDGPRILRYRDGIFQNAPRKYGSSEAAFTAMSKSCNGDLLIWGPKNRTLQFHDNQFRRWTPRDDIKGIVISSLQSSDQTLWLGTRDVGLYQLKNGHVAKISGLPGLQSVNALAPSQNGGVWIGTDAGLLLWERGKSVPLKLPGSLRKSQVFALTLDRDQNLWVGSEAGLFRVDTKRKSVTGEIRSADLTEITAIFEDAEGNIWFAGTHGIERLRDGIFTSFPFHKEFLKTSGGPIFTDDTDRVWYAPSSGGLFSFRNGVMTRYSLPGLDNDVIYSIAGDKGEIWLGRQQGGLTELTRNGDGWLSRTFTTKDGLAQNSVYTVTRARDGTIWAGTVSGGVSVLKHGHFVTYNEQNGLPSNAVFSSTEGSDHRMWFASPSGLLCFDGKSWMTVGASEVEPTPNVRTVFEDAGHVLWIGTSHGLARLVHGRIEVVRGVPLFLSEEILSIGQDAEGFFWIVTAQHVLQVNRDKLLSGNLSEQEVMSYGPDDGLSETRGVRRDRSLAIDRHGRIWLSLTHSLAVADLNSAEGYRRPVRVRIVSVSPGEAMVGQHRILELPSDTRNITFRYTGTNMSIPQRTQYRYLLENSDQSWSGGDSLRQVVYTHLSPGKYIFRIMASNGLGEWNGPESSIPIYIRPALWETWYLRSLCAFAFAIVVVLLYRLRLMQLTEQLNRRFRDRLAERTRIARDLHDTLLQGFISASMQLDVAEARAPENSAIRPLLNRVLAQMRQVTEEGRAALRGLRTIEGSLSPEDVFSTLAKEPLRDASTSFILSVEGLRKPLQGFVLEEVYRIGREACLNAFAHSRATQVEVVIKYNPRKFHLVIRDNGAGIEGRILKNGRDGHWGLAGMRERASAIQSTLKIRSRVPGGTEVELIVPSGVAYCQNRSRWRWPWQSEKSESITGRKRGMPL